MTRKKNGVAKTGWKALIGEDANLLKAIVQQALLEVPEAEMREALAKGSVRSIDHSEGMD